MWLPGVVSVLRVWTGWVEKTWGKTGSRRAKTGTPKGGEKGARKGHFRKSKDTIWQMQRSATNGSRWGSAAYPVLPTQCRLLSAAYSVPRASGVQVIDIIIIVVSINISIIIGIGRLLQRERQEICQLIGRVKDFTG